MPGLAAIIVEVLEPYIGRSLADTTVRASALSMGKMSDELSGADMPTLRSNIERVLSPVASRATVNQILAEIEGRSQ